MNYSLDTIVAQHRSLLYNHKDLDNVREKVLVSKPEGLKPLGLVMGVGGVVVAEFVNPASAKAQTDNFPDCGYGNEARWVNDSNGDGMPGPSGDEFFCTLLPDCYTTPPFGPKADIIAQDMSQEQFRANILARVVLCEGDEPWPDFEDFFDNNPWADELLLTNSSMLNDFLDRVPFYRNAYWAKRLEELQGNSSTESTPTEEPDSQTTVDEEQEPESEDEPEDEAIEEPVVEPVTEEPDSQTTVDEEQSPELEDEPEDEAIEEPVVEPVTEETDSQTAVDEEQEPEAEDEPEDEAIEEPVVEPAAEEPDSQTIVDEEQSPEAEDEPEDEAIEEPAAVDSNNEPESLYEAPTLTDTQGTLRAPEEEADLPTHSVTKSVTEVVSQVPESDTYVPEIIAVGSVSVLVIGALSVYLKRKYRR